ncbi:MAG TPA: DUF952 domain-containing protein, partial [Candidatus Sulfomarinibacteraceae bacterium]|nr:DUF952 domain-containing protein [Candidatus Sulfomarinibacteraceae bacterium]
CSTPEQVVGVANALYRGQSDLVLLAIDTGKARPSVRYEDCYETGQEFPHLYGPLNLDAVAQVLPFAADGEGHFMLPAALGERGALAAAAYPILEFDPSPNALIEPSEVLAPIDIPACCVLCFFQDVFADLDEQGRLSVLYDLGSEIGHNPVYEIEVDGRRLALCHPGVGAPLAAGFLEELIALGCRRFIICGGAGTLDGDLALGHIVVPSRAVRDEGTSYHYLPPGREVAASAVAVAAIEKVLQRDNVDYVVGKTWTTDAVYRETPARIQRRRAEGCITVEMEAAALFAVAQFRNVLAGQLLYCGDDVSSDKWDSRHWQSRTTVREKMFWLAAEACLEMGNSEEAGPPVP